MHCLEYRMKDILKHTNLNEHERQYFKSLSLLVLGMKCHVIYLWMGIPMFSHFAHKNRGMSHEMPDS